MWRPPSWAPGWAAGIWNFTNEELPLADVEKVKVEDVHFADSLLTLSYMISEDEL